MRDPPIVRSSLPRMRLLIPGDVPLFESLFKSLQVGCSRRILELFSRALLLEILLSHRVQLSFGRRHFASRRFLPGLLTTFVSSLFFRRCAVGRAMSVEHSHATNDERRYSHQHKETHGFELSGHKLTVTLNEPKHLRSNRATIAAKSIVSPALLVFVDCQLEAKGSKMKGSTKPERMDEPFSFKPDDRSHQSCVLDELGGNAPRCQSSRRADN